MVQAPAISGLRALVMSAICAAASTACNVEDLLPKFTPGRTAAKLSTELTAINAHDLPDGVEGIRIGIRDVWVHGPDGDDEWSLINSDELTFDYFGEDGSLTFEAIPVIAGSYDTVRIDFSEAEVQSGDRWHVASLQSESLDIQPESTAVKGNTLLELRFTGAKSVSGSMSSGFVLIPSVEANFTDAPPPVEDPDSETGAAETGEDTNADAGETAGSGER